MIPEMFVKQSGGKFADWVSQHTLEICNKVRCGKSAEAAGMLRANLGAVSIMVALRVFAHLDNEERDLLRAAVDNSIERSHGIARKSMLESARLHKMRVNRSESHAGSGQ